MIIHPEFWDKENQRVKKTYRQAAYINRVLNDMENNFLDHFSLLVRQKKTRREIIKELKELVPGHGLIEEGRAPDFWEVYEEFLTTKLGLGEQKAPTTKNYNTLKKNLLEFEKERKIKISFDNINNRFYEQFKLFLLNKPNPKYAGKKIVQVDGFARRWLMVPNDDPREGKEIGMLNDSISKYLQNLNSFMHWSHLNEFHDNRIYEKIKPKRVNKNENFALTQNELNQLRAFDLSISLNTVKLFTSYLQKKYSKRFLGRKEKTELRVMINNIKGYELALDIFLILCHSLQRFSDGIRLNKKNLNGNVLELISIKTQEKIRVPLIGYTFPVYEILQKYDFKIPKMEEQPFNRKIKKIFEILNLDRPVKMVRYSGSDEILIDVPLYEVVSSHCGRRTGATILIELGVPPSEVQKLGGWKDLRTMNKYINVSEESISRNLERANERLVG